MEKSSPPPPPSGTNPQKVVLTDEEKIDISKELLLGKFNELEAYVRDIEENAISKDEKLKLQQQESTRRENVLVMRLATKEQEMQELLAQIQELKQSQTPSTSQLQAMLIDPAVNLLFAKMKTELTETKDRLEQAQNDISAWKFTPDSVTGKKLMAKCRMLIQENQDLGKQLSQGRIAQLEAELALQKKYSEELKGSQDEMNEFVIQLDEEVEGMQATICALQQQLKKANEENKTLKQISSDVRSAKTLSPNGKINGFDKFTTSHNPLQDNRDIVPSSELKPTIGSYDQPMDVEFSSNQDFQTVEQIKRTAKQETQNENNIGSNQLTVIRGPDDGKRDVDSPVQHYMSPTKGLTKTSFSITDLLSTNSVKKDPEVSMEVTIGLKTEEHGENGLLNGEIDDAAI